MRRQLPVRPLRGLPAAVIASSTASRGTEEASTPSGTHPVKRPSAATTPLCVTTSDLAGPAVRTGRDAPKQDQTRLSGILRPVRGKESPQVGGDDSMCLLHAR